MEGKSLTLIAMLKCHMEYMGNNTSTKSVLFVQLQEISLVFLMVILNNITISTICFHLMKLVNKIGVITHSGGLSLPDTHTYVCVSEGKKV